MCSSITPIDKNQTFCFTCSPRVPCFNACCHDLQQVLTPYDVLCLKQYLGMPSSEFLQTFTEESTGPETGFPVISLRFGDSDERACPFVSSSGCRVYPARPSSCRTYPLARGVSRSRETGECREHWALIKEPHCLGFQSGEQQTVAGWVADQRIAEYNRTNDKMLELIGLKNKILPGPLRPSDSSKVYRALYDLDTFRMDLFSTHDEIGASLDPQILNRAKANDRDLLLAAIQWVAGFLTNLSSKKSV